MPSLGIRDEEAAGELTANFGTLGVGHSETSSIAGDTDICIDFVSLLIHPTSSATRVKGHDAVLAVFAVLQRDSLRPFCICYKPLRTPKREDMALDDV